MKIGILTFHWATNFGAVLQSYALFHYLQKIGHEVIVIDYKPSRYDNSFYRFVRNRKFLYLNRYFFNIKREYELKKFRLKNLKLTQRYYSQDELRKNYPDCDVYISGSDQIFNPSFVRGGDRFPALTYFLDFGESKTKRIGYAVSFGCTKYPLDIAKIVKKPADRFNAISCREKTGIEICADFNKDAILVPDPTLLLEKRDYLDLFKSKKKCTKGNSYYIYSYILHGRENVNLFLKKEASKILMTEFFSRKIYSLEEWMDVINSSKYMVTNSFHGLMMSLIFNVPFVVVLETLENTKMNDRFYTILSKLSMENRIVLESEKTKIIELLKKPIEWEEVNTKLVSFRNIGVDFLNSQILS